MVRNVATVFGVVLLLAGLLGLVSVNGMSLVANPAPAAVFGIFPVNLLHNAVHILFGVWGLIASRSFARARQFVRVGGVIYLGLAILGFVVPTMFELMPIGGNSIGLHAVVGLVLAGVGFTAKATTEPQAPTAAKT